MPTVEAAAVAEGSGAPTSLDVSITPAGSDRLLVSFFHRFQGDKTANSWDFNTSETITSQHGQANTGSDVGCELGTLTAPTATADNVTVTWDSGGFATKVGAIALSGVDQTTPITGATGADADDLTISSATGDLVIAGVSVNDTTVTSDDTEQYNANANFFSGVAETAAGAASVNVSFSGVTSADCAIAGCNIQAAAGGGDPAVHNMLLLGVGQ